MRWTCLIPTGQPHILQIQIQIFYMETSYIEIVYFSWQICWHVVHCRGQHGREGGRAAWAYALIPLQRALQQQLAPHSTTSGAFWAEREGKQHSSMARAIKDAAQHQSPL